MKRDIKSLLDLRNYLKLKKPDFLRQDAHKVKKIDKKWARPKGRHSKMRVGLRGHGKRPSIGYSSPREVKGLNKQGLKEVLVNNINDLKKVKDKDKEVILLASNLGLKKRIEILKKVKELKLKIANIKDIDSFVSNVESFLRERKKKKEEKKPKKEAEKIEVKEEKKEEEKEIKRKVLEKRRPREK